MIFFFLPETLRAKKLPATTAQVDENTDEMSRVSTTQSLQRKTKKFAAILKACLIDPLAIIANLRFPAIALVVSWASITFGAVSLIYFSMHLPNTLPYISILASLTLN